MAGGPVEESQLFLATLPADRGERRLALATVLASAAVFAAVAPFARQPLAEIPAFLGIYQSALVICDLITAVLLFGQFAILGSRALLVLASGYLFSAAMAVLHALSFPGLFSPAGLLGAGPQTTAWLYFFWHLGFPAATIGYALLRDASTDGAARRTRAIALAVAAAATVAAALALLATAGHEALPVIMRGHADAPAKYVVAWGTLLFTLAALPALWRRRGLSVLDLWLMVVICAWAFDVALAAVFNAGRYSVGWYAGRVYGLAAASFVLVVLLLENSSLYARLARSQQAAQLRRRALESMMESIADGIMMLDPDGTIRSWNAAATRMFGYSAEEVVGRNIAMLLPEDQRSAQGEAMRRLLDTGVGNVIGHVDFHCTGLRRDGSRFEAEFTVTEMGGGSAPHFVAVFRDITARKQAEERLARLALHDSLTDLPNRPYFEQRFAETVTHCHRRGKPLALMVLDLDNLKPVNDTLGHEVGDQLLVAFGRRMKSTLRESDLLARIGGDEFIVVVEDVKGEADAAAIAEKLLAALCEPLDAAGHSIAASASIGIAVCRASESPQDLMKRADRALYRAKRAGRARYHIDVLEPA